MILQTTSYCPFVVFFLSENERAKSLFKELNQVLKLLKSDGTRHENHVDIILRTFVVSNGEA